MNHPRPPGRDTDLLVRNRRMLLVGIVMAVLAFVVAAGYWYTHQPGKAPTPPTAMVISRVGADLVVGPANARHQLVIEEQFGCARCATFERSSQTFLQANAAAGIVRVRYVIPKGSSTEYDAVLATDPAKALQVHDRLFAALGGSSRDTLRVTLDGRILLENDPIALANALETALAKKLE